MKRDASSPSAYRADVEAPLAEVLEAVRDAVLAAKPDVDEGIRYGMLDYPGLANLAAQKRYVALYVASSVLARHKERFPGVGAGKSCLRFERIDQVDRPALDRLLRDVRVHREETQDDG